jgi:integrase
LKQIVFQLRWLCHKKHSGAHATHTDRKVMLQHFGRLLDAKFPKLQLENLSQKHVDFLVEFIKNGTGGKTDTRLSAGTQKNMLAGLRWLLRAVNKSSLLTKSNDELGIERRKYVTNRDKSIILDVEQITRICELDRLVGASLHMQIAFGLRIEESLKIIPSVAFRGDHIRLNGSWTKGNVPRSIPILNEQQRLAITEAVAVSKGRALIPDGQSFVPHRRYVRGLYATIGLKRTHGLRHAYAIRRFEELAGFPSPVRGGPVKKDQSSGMRERDQIARETLSEELGHHRIEITKTYVGSATFKVEEFGASEVD